jgi:sugar lactone lactonase YvrE
VAPEAFHSGTIGPRPIRPEATGARVLRGGPDLKDLYVTSAWGWLTDEERAAAPGSGDLWVVHTDIQGLPEPKFAG